MMALALLFGRATRWFSLVLVGLFLVAVVGLVDPQVDIGVARRISVDQIVANVTERVRRWRCDPCSTGRRRGGSSGGTRSSSYTIGGEYFWSGKGYGINLADADGFQVTADGSLRAPHNGHIEVLARAGVPGLLLWIGVQAGVRADDAPGRDPGASRRARALGRHRGLGHRVLAGGAGQRQLRRLPAEPDGRDLVLVDRRAWHRRRPDRRPDHRGAGGPSGRGPGRSRGGVRLIASRKRGLLYR